MATKTAAAPRLTDAQLSELMRLMRGSDSVELKLTVPPPSSAPPFATSGSTRWMPRSARCFSSTRPTLRSTRRASSCARAGSRAAAAIR